jgi:hypothetical protein
VGLLLEDIRWLGASVSSGEHTMDAMMKAHRELMRLQGRVAPDEREPVELVQGALLEMGGFVDEFRHALILFDTAEANIPKFEKVNPNWARVLRAWQRVACRDGAMQLYHVETVMRLIGKILKAAPTLQATADHRQRRAALKQFAASFPRAKLIRDAVGHSFSELSLNDGIERHIARKADVGGVLSLTGRVQISDTIVFREYVVTIAGKVHSYELSGENLAKLHRAYEVYLTSFFPSAAAPPAQPPTG